MRRHSYKNKTSLSKDEKRIILLSVTVFLVGGWPMLKRLWGGVLQVLTGLFPIFADIGIMKLEDYLTSPYFISGVIMFVLSLFGIWLGKKKGKALHLVVSLALLIIDLFSIASNIIVTL